ncbi:DODA-type extradiol aromatic ring-opening family dioxygenase [Gellertiella hungarica]|uniref:Aromatic ring-opening dioxygenase catalytic subunit (LigB family) n=1 Tax=Gellertiella hungarica TaxID=1572859 RepID=A0A7W6NN54_9HYPH|nr:class III extradiol ring-cleavage dioxygenase [Gellertiella hungarica]MBB4067120.1 aromatic ring-opening dioxygenase catalytic subunit (LigB family) [Gellertiella hungarica]
MSNRKLPVYFIPHGGGPWPFMDFPKNAAGKGPWDDLGTFLRGLSGDFGGKPKAVLVVSGHWEKEPKVAVSTASQPGMLYDYYNFPPHTYELRYPARGAPDVAEHVREVLSEAGIETRADAERGFDHGVFIPFMLIYPDADVPIVMMSLDNDLSAATHLKLGKALERLRNEDILIIGSGMSYHNMRKFRSDEPDHVEEAKRFDRWLTEAVEAGDPETRNATLARWEENPDARACHVPDHDHLVPLFVAAGAAGPDRGRKIFETDFLGKPYSAYRFG